MTLLRMLVVFSPLAIVGCGAKLSPEQQRVQAEIVKAHQGDTVTFLSWSQVTAQEADIMQYMRAQAAIEYDPVDATRRKEYPKQEEARNKSLADRELMKRTWKTIDEELAVNDDKQRRSSRALSESRYKAEWADEDEKWKDFIAKWTEDEDQAKLRDENLSAPNPKKTFVHVRYRAPNKVGLNQLEDDVFSVEESKIVQITDKKFVEWLQPKMKLQ